MEFALFGNYGMIEQKSRFQIVPAHRAQTVPAAQPEVYGRICAMQIQVGCGHGGGSAMLSTERGAIGCPLENGSSNCAGSTE